MSRLTKVAALSLIVIFSNVLLILPASKANSQAPSEEPTTSSAQAHSTTPSRLRLHWDCLKSGGKWKSLSQTRKYDTGKKIYSETKMWSCQMANSSAGH